MGRGSLMNKIVTMTALMVLLGVSSGRSQEPGATVPKSTSSDLRPAPEMQRLLDAFVGNWHVNESFEVSASRQGKTRQGTAAFRAGPGYSLIEDYKSTGSAGTLHFLGLLWWDESAHIYRLLTCANNDGCQLRGTTKWEGKELVNSWEENVDGKTARFKDSFVHISRSSFRLVSEGSTSEGTIWRVITEYTRIERK